MNAVSSEIFVPKLVITTGFAITKKLVAYVIIEKEDPFIQRQIWSFYIVVISGIIVLLFTFLFIYRELANKHLLQQVSEKTKKILDVQHSIVILSDGQVFAGFTARTFSAPPRWRRVRRLGWPGRGE